MTHLLNTPSSSTPQAEIERSSTLGFPNQPLYKHHQRSAFSLLEAILAMALLAGVAAVLFELAFVGRSHLQDADRRFQAQLLCQNRLREILCGIEPLVACESTPINGSPGWCATVELEPVDNHTGVQLLKITVSEETDSLLDDPDAPGVCSFTLAQWVPDLGTPETSSTTPSQAGIEAPTSIPDNTPNETTPQDEPTVEE